MRKKTRARKSHATVPLILDGYIMVLLTLLNPTSPLTNRVEMKMPQSFLRKAKFSWNWQNCTVGTFPPKCCFSHTKICEIKIVYRRFATSRRLPIFLQNLLSNFIDDHGQVSLYFRSAPNFFIFFFEPVRPLLLPDERIPDAEFIVAVLPEPWPVPTLRVAEQ